MKRLSSNFVQAHFVIIACILGTTFSASLFRMILSAPQEVVKTGMQEISQVLKPNVQHHLSSSISYNHDKEGTTNKKEDLNIGGIVENQKLKTQEPPKIIELALTSQISDSRPAIKKPNDNEMPGLLDQTSQSTTAAEGVTGGSMLACPEPETNVTITTDGETSELETTTTSCDLNRIGVGGVPPGVLASMLG